MSFMQEPHNVTYSFNKKLTNAINWELQFQQNPKQTVTCSLILLYVMENRQIRQVLKHMAAVYCYYISVHSVHWGHQLLKNITMDLCYYYTTHRLTIQRHSGLHRRPAHRSCVSAPWAMSPSSPRVPQVMQRPLKHQLAPKLKTQAIKLLSKQVTF